ncbi:MAG: cation:proton antiporter [Candidatus Goldiibacteriota bacterium]
MHEELLLQLGIIIVLGVSAQWISWQLRLPSILLLIVLGFLSGPVFNLVNPDEIFGKLLFPLVSFFVAIILFEGGLNLNIKDLKKIGGAVNGLITTGAAVTFGLSSMAACYVLGMDWKLSVLFGAILVVTGPTVIMPLLSHLRPSKKVSQILKWEGIVIDPIGVILAVLVFEVLFAGGLKAEPGEIIAAVGKTAAAGAALGAAGGFIYTLFSRKYWVPDFLLNPFSLMILAVVFIVSNMIQDEAGLLAATVMGIYLASQDKVSTRQVFAFLEEMRILLISLLFIILAARLPVDFYKYANLEMLIFIGILIFFVRPAAVFAATVFSKITLKERLFISSVAPRGIVAAAMASVFALRLEEIGYPDYEKIAYFVFVVIAATIVIYGLGSGYMGKLLKQTKERPQGLLLIGAHKWARDMAAALSSEGIEVILVDTNYSNITSAKIEGLNAYYINVMQSETLDRLPIEGAGKMLALTSNDQVNILSVIRFRRIFGSQEVYRIISTDESRKPEKIVRRKLRGRLLFDDRATFDYIHDLCDSGAKIKKTKITEDFDYDEYLKVHGHKAMPLFIIDKKKELIVITRRSDRAPKEGEILISLVGEGKEIEL